MLDSNPNITKKCSCVYIRVKTFLVELTITAVKGEKPPDEQRRIWYI